MSIKGSSVQLTGNVHEYKAVCAVQLLQSAIRFTVGSKARITAQFTGLKLDLLLNS